MKQNIHPDYYDNIEIVCACGNIVVSGSTLPGPVRVEICSHCHPFWTGDKRLVDTEGRVERFAHQVEAAQQTQTEQLARKQKKDQPKKQKNRILTLKELLEEAR